MSRYGSWIIPFFNTL